MTEQHKCCRMVGSVFAQYACDRNAKYEHLGKWYCKTHHPPTVWAKREARSAEWNREFAARQLASKEAQAAKDEAARRAALYPELLEALKNLEKEFRKVYPIYYYAEPWGHETNVPLQAARAAIARAEGEPK
jgi:hypothetical protein